MADEKREVPTQESYVFKGVHWQQKILSYDEFGLVIKILKGELTSIPVEQKPFEETIERWYESGRLRELYKVILKPSGTPWQRLRNSFLFLTRRANKADPIRNLDLREMALVNQGFFLLNSEWIGNLMLTQRSLELSHQLVSRETVMSRTMNSFTGSPREAPATKPS